MNIEELYSAMVERANQTDNQRCDYDRYDEGYADAMYDAIDMVREMLEETT